MFSSRSNARMIIPPIDLGAVSPDVVVLDDVWKKYGGLDALRGVSFTLRSGESVGYLGPNGAGKSTTLKLLAGVSAPSKGSVRVLGFDPIRQKTAALRRLGALVETPGIPPYVRGSDLLDYIAEVKGTPRSERHAVAARAADATGVREHLDRPFGTLSTGLGRRLLLAGALIGDPEVLLLDEPTLGLDPAERRDLRDLLRRLAQQGRSLLLSTHLLEDVQDICTRVLFLRDGSLVGDEPVDLSGEGSGRRSVTVQFARSPAPEMLAQAAGPGTELERPDPLHATFRISGGDSEQAELVERLVRGGAPVVGVTLTEPDLARRYLERVGRQEAT